MPRDPLASMRAVCTPTLVDAPVSRQRVRCDKVHTTCFMFALRRFRTYLFGSVFIMPYTCEINFRNVSAVIFNLIALHVLHELI